MRRAFDRAARADLGLVGGRSAIVVAAGKAAASMATAFAEHVGASGRRGLVAGPRPGGAALPSGLQWFDSGHPYPNAASAAAGARALELAALSGPGTPLVVLLSGGASALLAAPAAGISLEDKMSTSRSLMEAGAAIDALNCVRKHLSAVKGGRLGACAWQSVTLAISDVHGPIADDPSVIGSGPTVADPTTFGEALATIEAAGARVPHAVLAHLERGARGTLEETIKPGDPRLGRAHLEIIGNRMTALMGAARAADALGYTVVTIPEAVVGDASHAGRSFVSRARDLAAGRSLPVCVLASGETTVRVVGKGRGGRNQELVLAAAPLLRDIGADVLLASAGTDGIDGPTDAAGAIADRTTVERGHAAGLDWEAALADNDAYRFFAPLGDLIMSGPTGTNVGDLQVCLLA